MVKLGTCSPHRELRVTLSTLGLAGVLVAPTAFPASFVQRSSQHPRSAGTALPSTPVRNLPPTSPPKFLPLPGICSLPPSGILPGSGLRHHPPPPRPPAEPRRPPSPVTPHPGSSCPFKRHLPLPRRRPRAGGGGDAAPLRHLRRRSPRPGPAPGEARPPPPAQSPSHRSRPGVRDSSLSRELPFLVTRALYSPASRARRPESRGFSRLAVILSGAPPSQA